MNRPRLLIDVDEVLVNFADPAVKVLSDIFGCPWTFDQMLPGAWDMFAGLSPEQKARVAEVLEDPAWYNALEPYPGAQNAVERLREFSDIYVVTAAITWAPDRIWWLKKHFGFEKDHLIFTKAKHVVAGDFFLDDHPGHVLRWQQEYPKGHGMLWTSPNNRHLKEYGHIRVYDWDTVLNRVRNWYLGVPSLV
jgi:5'(3')-deoxyribonucleotidase